MHHYIFNAYEINKDTNVMGPNVMDGSVYYKQILEPIIKNKDVMATFQFTVYTK